MNKETTMDPKDQVPAPPPPPPPPPAPVRDDKPADDGSKEGEGD